MSLQINRSFAAMSAGALNSLHSNQTTMGKAITRVSTGKRVNSAADDISAYIGSKRFQSDADGYKALNNGVQNGAAYLNSVSNAFDSFSNTLQEMRSQVLKFQDAKNNQDTDAQTQAQTTFNNLKASLISAAKADIGSHTNWLDTGGNMTFTIGLESTTAVTSYSDMPATFQFKDAESGVSKLSLFTNDDTISSKFDSNSSTFNSATKVGLIYYNSEAYVLNSGNVTKDGEVVGSYSFNANDRDSENSVTALSISWRSDEVASGNSISVSWGGIESITHKVSALYISDTNIFNDISETIKEVSKEQAKIGGAVNSLEIISNHLSEMASAEEAAYTTLTEADMAEEMTKYVKSNIYAQASQAMIAQANQSLAQVLNLLE